MAKPTYGAVSVARCKARICLRLTAGTSVQLLQSFTRRFADEQLKSGRSWATAQDGQHLLSQIERRAIFQIRPNDLNADRKSVFQADGDHRRGQITSARRSHPRCQIPIRALFAADQTRTGCHRLGVIMCDSWAGHNREQNGVPASKELFPSFAQLKAAFVVAEPLSVSHR